MQTLLNASLSASGSPSEVKQRIADQVALATSPDQSAALGAARTFIEKTIAGVSEDDTLSVNATIVVSVVNAPPVVTAKVQALSDAKTAAETRAASLTTQLATITADLAAAKALIAQPTTIETASGTPTAVGV
jgi:hypothetical protein